MKVLVLGVSGMLGSSVYKHFHQKGQYNVFGTARSSNMAKYFNINQQKNIIYGIDVLHIDLLLKVFSSIKPDIVVNCVGLIKQLENAKDPLEVLPINSILPHQLSRLCTATNARLIHVSTDCVYSGKFGGYVESSVSDACDLYGMSKFIGEVNDSSNSITLRTSIIGHELNTNHALVDWFLNQEIKVKGYTKAVFSGLPTDELAHVIHDFVLPNKKLRGLYHVSAEPITKHDLLQLIANRYDKSIEIIPDESVSIDRSLNSDKFKKVTGYQPPSWERLVDIMYKGLSVTGMEQNK